MGQLEERSGGSWGSTDAATLDVIDSFVTLAQEGSEMGRSEGWQGWEGRGCPTVLS